MAKEKQKTVEVTLDGGKKVKVVVRKPTNRVSGEAQRIGAKVWTDCIRDGIMTKKELEVVMKSNGMWDKSKQESQDAIIADLRELEKKLYLGKKGSKMKLSQAKDIAFEMRKKRLELRDLLASKIELEGNTAESLSENAKFDYLVANCTFYEDGKNVYNSVEEYNDKSEDPIAFSAAATLAALMYSLDKDFEEKLPENQFLIKANLVNDDLALVNKDGNRVDTEGRLINDLGQYVDGDGNRVDIDGHPLDADGNYIPQLTYTHENGKAVKLAVEPKEETVPEETQETEEAEDKTES
tara:strand:+ start:245 stop:1132 length:888 start_codon:yes stop_codon:yes gene_type:complete